MSTPVTINGTTFNLPTQSQNPPWGNDLSEIIEALVAIANTQAGPGSILSTTFSMANNVTSPSNITGLSFDPAIVTTAKVDYAIKRSTSTTSLVERGILLVSYDPGTSTWSYSLTGNGDAGITLSIVSGQFQYTSSSLGGTGHQCTFSFSAGAFS